MLFKAIGDEKLMIRRAAGQAELTMDEFNANSEELLFRKICKDHFTALLRYPQ